MTSLSKPDGTYAEAETLLVVDAARNFFRANFGYPEASYGACLYWSLAAIKAAQAIGIRLVLQAGSAAFRRLPPHLDDGKPETLPHFAYVWTPPLKDPLRSPVTRDGDPTPDYLTTRPDPLGRPRLCLPEIHVWAGYVGDGRDPATMRVVDLSTFALKDQCQALMGAPWLEKDPPRYLWCRPNEIPDGWHYEPTREATMLAANLGVLALTGEPLL